MQRIQRKRTKGWRMPENAVNVCRPTKWGNVFVVGKDGTAQECVDLFTSEIHHPNSRLGFTPDEIETLRGKDLACFCKIGEPCHADVLLAIANRPRRVLRLTLKRKWFEMICRDEKKEEYRSIAPWILSRLQNKSYDVVHFTNGYGSKVPWVTVEYLGWGTGIGKATWGATTGKPTVIIRLGKIIAQQTNNNQQINNQ